MRVMALWLLFSLLLVLYHLPETTAVPPEGNATLGNFRSAAATFDSSSVAPPPLLKEILEVISINEQWGSDAMNFSGIKIRIVKAGVCSQYEFNLRVKKTVMKVTFGDEVLSWKRFRSKWINLRSGLVLDKLVSSSEPALESLEFEGPLELAITGEDKVPLMLPMNTTLTGFKRILVGEGIKVSVQGAQLISLAHPCNFGLPFNRSVFSIDYRSTFLWSFGYSSPLLHLQILGPSSLSAFRTSSASGHIQTAFLSPDTVELVSEKCYTGQPCSGLKNLNQTLQSRLLLLGQVLRSLLGNTVYQKGGFRVRKAKIAAFSLVHFELELEKEVDNNDKFLESLPAWRTRPKTRRLLFDVTARLEAKQLKPVIIKKVKPFVTVDSVSWSTLLSNVSSSRLSSVRVSPESMTLDVKW